MFRATFKIGKSFCFPDAPSTWVPRTVESIQKLQDLRKINQVLYPNVGSPCSSPLKFQTRIRDGDDSDTIKDGYLWCHQHYSQLQYYFETTDRMVIKNECVSLQEGETFDVISLLSGGGDYLVRNNGDIVQVESLRGKNIIVCCFWVPCFWLSLCCKAIRGLITGSSKLNSEYEMVMVAKMRRNWANDEDAFNHFFSGFPSSWLAVPFSDTILRDRVCNAIGLDLSTQGLIVDHNQKVVEHNCLLDGIGFSMPPFSVPFTELCAWWKTHTRLSLNLDSDLVFRIVTNNRSNAASATTVGVDGDNKVSVSQLEEKVVGLYLCYDGTFIRTLDLVSQECNARNKEFHIVLVYLPYREGVHPLLFQEAINQVLYNLEISADSNWWVSPFDNFVSYRLWEVCDFCSKEDQLVIFDPNMNIADPFGKDVLDFFGVNAYPFTRESLVRRELEALRAVTLESLLVYGSRDYVYRINNDSRNPDQVLVAELQGKFVLLYIICQEEKPSSIYCALLQWYNNWTKTTEFVDFEVVVVPFDGEVDTSFGTLMPMPPWLMCPFDPQHTIFLKEKTLMTGIQRDKLIAFDKDGHVVTLNAKADFLASYGPKGFPSYNGLRREVVSHFDNNHGLDMDDV